ncbi:MAG: hypothetical protein IKA05_05065 [Clostridia bacterium]|nr:hypothetical protein [Clostridia bacterium]
MHTARGGKVRRDPYRKSGRPKYRMAVFGAAFVRFLDACDCNIDRSHGKKKTPPRRKKSFQTLEIFLKCGIIGA